MNDERQEKATCEQISIQNNFVEAIKDMNPFTFWDLLSSESKGYLKGSYYAVVEEDISRTSELS